MDENQRITKSFDFAADVTKQLIALSTAIISLCVAFTDKIFSSDAAQSHSFSLLVSLGLFVLSIIFGIFTLMALAGHLGKPTTGNGSDTQQGQAIQPAEGQTIPPETTASPIYEGNVRFFSVGQMLIFIVAIVMAMIYVWKASSTTTDEPVKQLDTEKCLKVIRVSDYTIENSQVIDTLCLDPRSGQ